MVIPCDRGQGEGVTTIRVTSADGGEQASRGRASHGWGQSRAREGDDDTKGQGSCISGSWAFKMETGAAVNDGGRVSRPGQGNGGRANAGSIKVVASNQGQ
eukprot:Gb_27002 [translate_table: standard]